MSGEILKAVKGSKLQNSREYRFYVSANIGVVLKYLQSWDVDKFGKA